MTTQESATSATSSQESPNLHPHAKEISIMRFPHNCWKTLDSSLFPWETDTVQVTFLHLDVQAEFHGWQFGDYSPVPIRFPTDGISPERLHFLKGETWNRDAIFIAYLHLEEAACTGGKIEFQSTTTPGKHPSQKTPRLQANAAQRHKAIGAEFIHERLSVMVHD